MDSARPMKIKIPVANPYIDDKDIERVLSALRSGWVSSQSPYVSEFERKFAEWVGVKHAIAVSSGTAALHLSLLALGVKANDEVIVPNLTFAAPANMVVAVNARPIFVDVTKEYWCIDPLLLRNAISCNTKAIIVVHLYGHPAKMDEIIEVSEKYGLYIIEDCAEAHGAMFKGRKVGSLGTVGVFSFYANKVITTGEGGMVVTNNDELADKIRLLRDHGMRPRYWHVIPGFNYRMSGLQAALGLSQLEKIEKLLEYKRKIARIYSEELRDIPGLTLHPEMEWATCIYWLYSVIINPSKFGCTRDFLMKILEKYGIETRRFFYPLHTMPAFSRYSSHSNYPISSYLADNGLSLPSGPKISEEEILYVAQMIKRVHKRCLR